MFLSYCNPRRQFSKLGSYTILTLAFFWPHYSYSCECPDHPTPLTMEDLQKAIDGSEMVFIGKAESLKQEKTRDVASFRPERFYKLPKNARGTKPEKVAMESSLQAWSCDMPFEENQRYVVFATYKTEKIGNKTRKSSTLSMDMCSLSAKVEDSEAIIHSLQDYERTQRDKTPLSIDKGGDSPTIPATASQGGRSIQPGRTIAAPPSYTNVPNAIR